MTPGRAWRDPNDYRRDSCAHAASRFGVQVLAILSGESHAFSALSAA